MDKRCLVCKQRVPLKSQRNDNHDAGDEDNGGLDDDPKAVKAFPRAHFAHCPALQALTLRNAT